MDIDKYMEQVHREREEKRQKFLQKALSKMTGEMAYWSLALLICERFHLSHKYRTPDVAYVLTEYFVNEVDEPFTEWVNKDDAPFVRPLSEARKIFHEFSFLETDNEIVELANKIYGLDLHIDYEEMYMYSFSFDFNSFTPIDMGEIKELKTEISVLEKHNIDCSELYRQLDTYGLTEEQLELI